MYAAVSLFVFVCLTATTLADHHHPCHPPNMTGSMTLMSMKGEVKGFGTFTYDAMHNKLRFISNENLLFNTTKDNDLLMFFNEGVFFEIDNKNQSCEKKALQSTMHPLDIPDDAKSLGMFNFGNPSIEGEGLKFKGWTGSMHGVKGHYIISVSTGCLPLSTIYFSGSTSFIVSLMDVELEIKDPDLLAVPSFCLGQPLEETPEGTVNSFVNEFM